MIHKETKDAYHQKKVATAAARKRKTEEKTEKQKTSSPKIGVLNVIPAVKPLIKRK